MWAGVRERRAVALERVQPDWNILRLLPTRHSLCFGEHFYQTFRTNLPPSDSSQADNALTMVT